MKYGMCREMAYLVYIYICVFRMAMICVLDRQTDRSIDR